MGPELGNKRCKRVSLPLLFPFSLCPSLLPFLLPLSPSLFLFIALWTEPRPYARSVSVMSKLYLQPSFHSDFLLILWKFHTRIQCILISSVFSNYPPQTPSGPTNPSHSQHQVVIINSPPSPINVDCMRLAVEPHADS